MNAIGFFLMEHADTVRKSWKQQPLCSLGPLSVIFFPMLLLSLGVCQSYASIEVSVCSIRHVLSYFLGAAVNLYK